MRRVAVLLILLLLLPGVSAYQIPEKGVIYQIMVDRFYDGNSSNNAPLYDPDHRNYRLYWGGDLEGITEKLDYLQSLGVTVLWLSPLNDNVDTMVFASAPYHGYWTKDYKRIEEHFGDWEAFRRLVEEAKKRGICIVVDYVPNHSNPATDGEFGALYDNGTFITNYYADRKNATVNPYTGSIENVYRHNGNIKNYYGWEMKSKNLYGLADFNHLNPWVDSYLKEGAELFVNSGACGFRLDAVKHMDLGWLVGFYTHFDEPLFTFGEYYKLDTSRDDDMGWLYLYSDYAPVINIPIRGAIVDTFAKAGSMKRLAETLEGYFSGFVYPAKQINFLDSHDLVRFLNENPDRERYHMALALTLTLPGVPVVYYGDESYLVSHDGNGDPYNRPMMVFDNATEASRIIRTLAELRKNNDGLAYGNLSTLYADYDTWAFERAFGGERVLVVVNKLDSRELSLNLGWPDGTYRDVLYGVEMEVKGGKAVISAPAHRVLVFPYGGEQKKPLLGSLTPYTARPGMRVIVGGALEGDEDFFVGGKKAKVVERGEGYAVIAVPELKTPKAWIDVWAKGKEESNHLKLHYLSGKVRASLLVVNASLVNGGELWIKGDIPELAEPMPLFRNGEYYFQIVPLPEGRTFSVELYGDDLEPLNVTLYGRTNATVLLTTEKPEEKGTCGPALILLVALLALLFRGAR
ncbi:alpha-amylase family glycosyl hydrolase [Palaeococcus ferrophilus]|uniref:alpha-amylase family glycosyl hydrolase n=1 Tax=Palaeococcus ferrophilus TaxID=83868 RepID=UPI00064F2CE0|nr:alpha-amylase family glycosyl hydrolase [Palaeococcus ferrophilus]